MLDTIRFEITDSRFFFAVKKWRREDLSGMTPARINLDVLREMVNDGHIVDMDAYRDKKLSELLADMNVFGLEVVVKDFFQLYRQGSWQRDITLVLDQHNGRVLVECSLPKFFNGHNVELLMDYKARIFDLVNYLYMFFKVRSLSSEQIRKIILSRVDICYYYKFPSQIHATDFIRAFRVMFKNKRKKLHHYNTSVMFTGRSFSMKFYMKLDEFRAHDKKDIYKRIDVLTEENSNYKHDEKEFAKRHYQWQKFASDYMKIVDHAESLANGMVRCEFTLRKQKLNYDGLYCLGDLIDLDIVAYYEKLLSMQGVLEMAKSGADEVFDKLKADKKLLQYSALLEIYGPEKIKEVYSRNSIYKYNTALSEIGIGCHDFKILHQVDLHVLGEHRQLLEAQEDNYHLATRFANGELF